MHIHKHTARAPISLAHNALVVTTPNCSGGFGHLQEKGVTKVYSLSRGLNLPNRPGHKNVFVLSTDTTGPTEVAAQELETAGDPRRLAMVCFVPHVDAECMATLEECGALGRTAVDTVRTMCLHQGS